VADLLRQRVAPCLQLLRVGLYFFAFVFQCVKRSGIERKTTIGEAFGQTRKIAAQ
jgi:hypothetical protein